MNEEKLEALLSNIPPASSPGTCVDDGLLLDHREGRLSQEKVEEVEKHLAACPACRALLAELDPVPAATESWALGTLQRRRRWPAISAIAALAAGLALALILLPRDDLPSYELIGPFGGVRTTRGEGRESLLFLPRSTFQIVVRPEVRIGEPVSMLVFVEASDGTLSRAPDRGISAGDRGGFRYELSAGEMFGEGHGQRRVHAVVLRGTIDEQAFEGSQEQVRRRLPAHRWMTVQVEYRASVEE